MRRLHLALCSLILMFTAARGHATSSQVQDFTLRILNHALAFGQMQVVDGTLDITQASVLINDLSFIKDGGVSPERFSKVYSVQFHARRASGEVFHGDTYLLVRNCAGECSIDDSLSSRSTVLTDALNGSKKILVLINRDDVLHNTVTALDLHLTDFI